MARVGGRVTIDVLRDGRYRPTPFLDRLPIPRVLRPAARQGSVATLRITMRTAQHKFHRALPPSRVWAYEGMLPGPTVEVERDQELHVEWVNSLVGTLPIVSVLAPEAKPGEVPVQCLPGRSGGEPLRDVTSIQPWTVVHLHGGSTPAQSDGWTENMISPGQSSVCSYPLKQRAAMLWYHDHAMGITKYNVYAGLAGLCLVRDIHERELHLPAGAPVEIPLMIQDRNFDLDARGKMTGQLLHKTDTGTMECFGPYTTVNGRIWPYHSVAPSTYRLRVLNGSNARTYRLVLVDESGRRFDDRIRQIGTDGGLLHRAASLPADGLILASAERADLLVDFADLAPGTRLRVLNTASAPFDGAPPSLDAPHGQPDLEGLTPFREVMEFRITKGKGRSVAIPTALSEDFRQLKPTMLRRPVVRAIALVEQEMEGQVNMLTMRELMPIAEPTAADSVITIHHDQERSHWRTVASNFEDEVTIFPVIGRDELWRLINLTGDTHPIHLHLAPFQVLARHGITWHVLAGGIRERDTAAEIHVKVASGDTVRHVVDANEQGLKDTVRVNPNEIVDLAVRFEPYAGRYMYHCHILEHEDRDMMRPVVVMPAELMDFMTMPPNAAMEDQETSSSMAGMTNAKGTVRAVPRLGGTVRAKRLGRRAR